MSNDFKVQIQRRKEEKETTTITISKAWILAVLQAQGCFIPKTPVYIELQTANGIEIEDGEDLTVKFQISKVEET